MEKRLRLLTWLLVGSLGLNVYSIFRIKSLESGIQNVNRNVSNINQTIYSVGGNLSSMINDITKGANWITKAEFKPKQEASSPSEIQLDLEWSFREIEQDAKVFLLYRALPDGEWIEEPAEQIEKGNFRAPLILSPQERYEYKITSQGNTLKTGDATVVPVKYYRPSPLIQRGISTSSGSNGWIDRYETWFYQLEPVVFDFFKVQDVKIEVIKNGEVAQVIPLQGKPSAKGDYPPAEEVFNFATKMDKDLTAFVLEVTYGDGTTQRGEIYPNNLYMEKIDREQKVDEKA